MTLKQNFLSKILMESKEHYSYIIPVTLSYLELWNIQGYLELGQGKELQTNKGVWMIEINIFLSDCLHEEGWMDMLQMKNKIEGGVFESP